MDWDDLRYLLALSRFSTMGRAAKHLGVNHTTVSRRLLALQERAGVRLIEKTGRGFTLTQAGQDAVRAAETMERQTLGLERQWFGQDGRLVGKVRVTTLDIMAQYYAPAFAEFTRLYPGIELELSQTNEPASLTRRQADVAIRMTVSPPEHLVGVRLVRFDYRLYGATSLLERWGRNRALDQYPWLAWDKALRARLTEAWMDEHVPGARVAARVDASLMMLDLARRGVGLTFLPIQLASAYPELEVLAKAPDAFRTDAWLLTHEELRHAARVRALMDHLKGWEQTPRRLD